MLNSKQTALNYLPPCLISKTKPIMWEGTKFASEHRLIALITSSEQCFHYPEQVMSCWTHYLTFMLEDAWVGFIFNSEIMEPFVRLLFK